MTLRYLFSLILAVLSGMLAVALLIEGYFAPNQSAGLMALSSFLFASSGMMGLLAAALRPFTIFDR